MGATQGAKRATGAHFGACGEQTSAHADSSIDSAMVIGRALIVLAAGCGADDQSVATEPTTEPTSKPTAEPGPVPAEMCPEGSWPVVAAYDLQTGGFGWAACTPGGGLFVMEAASEDTVWVQGAAGTQPEYLAFDAGSGEELWRGDESRFNSEVPADADRRVETPPVMNEIQLTGGQDDPIAGVGAGTGATVWTQPGHLVYDDVWAVGDGAVFAVENEYVPEDPKPPALAAYEVATGDVRWRRDLTANLWPFHATDQRLLVMWNNLQVVATDDGSVVWETDYPEPSSGFPRMMGGATNSRFVFVSFTSEGSGGD